MLASGLQFFCVLAAIMVLRPVREAMGLERGIEGVRLLFLCTVGVTLLLVPAFGYLVSRVRRGVFLAVSYRCCALILIGFYAAVTELPEPVCLLSKQLYYVYHSVFNLFVVSLFWAFMVDLFSVSESKRLFPAIAVGGTLGAICGPFVSARLADRIGVEWLFLVAACLLELAVWAAGRVARTRAHAASRSANLHPIGGHPLAGITLLARSPYLLGIALVILPAAVISTFFYFTKMRIVGAAVASLDERAVLFAKIDFWTQVGTLFAQAFLAGRAMRLMGVGAALAALPTASVAGFAILAAAPTLKAYMVVNATYRAVQRGIGRPARETLFTVLGPEEKYKVKAFLDTFGFRAGDAAGAQLERPLRELTPGLLGLTLAVLPIALVWAALCLVLGWAQYRLALHKPSQPA